MEYKTLADIRAGRTKARQAQGNALANMTPGRGVVSAMGQLGGMLTDQTMGAFGQFTPEEMKASSLDKILGSRKGPPQTDEENTALVTELAQAGHAQEARQAMLNWRADEQSRLKTDEMEMKNRAMLQLPQLEAEWNYGQAGKNFYRGYATKHFGIRDEATLATINSEDDLIMAMEQYTGGQTDSNSRAKYQKQLGIYDKAKKIAKDAFLGKKYRKDALGPVTKKLDLTKTGSTDTTTEVIDPNKAAARAKVLGNTATFDDKKTAAIVGYTDTPNITQVDPNAAGFWREKQEYYAKQDVFRAVSDAMVAKVPIAYFGELTLSPAEAKQDKINQEVRAWATFALEDNGYFSRNPGKVQEFIDDPHGFYNALPAKDKIKVVASLKKAKKKEK